MSTVISLLMV